MSNTLLKLLLFAGLSAALVQCSGDSDSDKVKMALIPEEPIVINAPFSYTIPPKSVNDSATIKEVAAPWFAFKYKLTNNSPQKVVLQTVKFTAKVVGNDGVIHDYESSIDPGIFDGYYLMDVAAGTEETSTITWLIDGLPENKSLHYSVTGELIGWFGEPTSPTKSFSQKIHFNVSGGE